MTDTASLVLKVDSTAVDGGAKSLDQLTRAGAKAEASTTALSKANEILASVMGKVAAGFALYKIADYVRDAALLNARYETLGISMVMVGKNAGYTAAQMEASAVAMQKGGISMVESRQQAMRLVQAHIDLADSTKLARIAQDAAVIGNINSSEAFARLVNGIQTGETEILRGIGLNVSMEQSYKKMAASLGVNSEALTQNQKTQAVLNAVVEQGASIAGTYEAAMSTAGKQLNSMARYQEDLKVKIGETFNEVLTVAVMAFTDHLKDANGQVSEMARNKDLEEWGHSLAGVFVDVLNTVNNLMVGVKMLGTYAGHSSAQSDIRSNYDQQRSSVSAFDMTKQAQLVAARDAALKAEQAQYEAAQVELAKSHDKFANAWEARNAARAKSNADAAAKDAKNAKDVQDAMVSATEKLTSHAITEKKYLEIVSGIRQKAFGDNHKYADSVVTATGATAKHGSALSKAATEYASTQKHAANFIATLEKEAATLGKSEAEIKAYDVAQVASTLHAGKDREAFIAKTASLMKLTEAQKLAVDWTKKQKEANDALLSSITSSNASAQSEIDSLRLHNEEIGLTKVQIDALVIARSDNVIAMAEEKLATTELTDGNVDYVSGLMDQIRLKRELRGLMVNGQALQATADEAKASSEVWKGMWSTVEQTGRTVFTNLFSEGKNTFEGIGKALKASVIDLLYQMTVKKWLISIGASLSGGMASMGFSGAANAGSGGTLGLVGNGASMANVAGALTADVGIASGATYGTGFGTQQSMMLAGQEAGMTAGAGSVAAYGGALGGAYYGYQQAGAPGAVIGAGVGYVGGAAIAGGISAAGGGVAAAASGAYAGATAAMAAIPVVGWIALAASAIYLAFGQAPGGDKTGGSASTQTNGVDDYAARHFTPDGADTQVQQTLDASTTLFNTMTARFGVAADSAFSLGFDSDPLGTANDRYSYTGNVNGQTFSKQDIEDGHRPEGESYKTLAHGAAAMLVEAFQHVDMGPVANAIVAGINPATITEAALAEVQIALSTAADLFGSAASPYLVAVSAVASDTSKLGDKFAALGVSGGVSAASLAKAVSALDLTTEAGQASARAMLQLGPALKSNEAQILSLIGQTAESMKNNLLNAIKNSPDAATAGMAFADSVVGGIQDSMLGDFAGQISSIITTGIVQPAINALLTGQAVSEALSEANIAEVVSKAQATASAFSAIWGNVDFQTALAGIKATVAGTTAAALQSSPINFGGASYTAAPDTSASDTLKAADDLASKRRALEIQEMQLLGNATGALAAQREDELKALDDTLDPLQERIWKLQDEAKTRSLEIQIMELSGDAAGALNAQRTEELKALTDGDKLLQQRIYRLQDEARLVEAGLAAAFRLDNATGGNLESTYNGQQAASNYNKAISSLATSFGTSTQQLESFIAANGGLIDTAGKYWTTLSDGQKQAVIDAANAQATLLESGNAAVRAALAGVQKSVDAERKRIADTYNNGVKAANDSVTTLNTSVSKLKSLTDALKGALRNMDMPGTLGAQRADAQAQIATALLIARSSGVLPDATSLTDALSTVAKPSEGLFGNFADYQRDFYRTAIDIFDLADISGSQLSDAQIQTDVLKAQLDTLKLTYDGEMTRLDKLIESYQSQADAILGVTGPKSISAAVDDLIAAMQAMTGSLADMANAVIIALGSGQTIDKTTLSKVTKNAPKDQVFTTSGGYQAYVSSSGTVGVDTGAGWQIQTPTGNVASLAEIQSGVSAAINAGRALDVYQAAVGNGVSGNDLDLIMGWSSGTASGWAVDNGLKPFAVGTNQVPYDMPAYVHRDERIIPAADNKELMARLRSPQGNNDVLVAEVRALREEVVLLRSEARATATHTNKTAKILERVIPNGDALAVRVTT